MTQKDRQMDKNTTAPVTSTAPITGKTRISGVAFRDFYKNHWPAEWYIDDMSVEIEDERGNYILPDDGEYALEDFGFAGWQAIGKPCPFGGYQIPVWQLYEMVMTPHLEEEIVSFRIGKEKLEDLLRAAEALGARHI